jgi:hypothetical protein
LHIALQFLAITSAWLLTTAPAFAHKLSLDCRVKDERVRVEAFYDDDTPAQQAKIFVENEGKHIVAEGRTDERGVWSCPLPAPGRYTVRAESVGHAAKETLVVHEPMKKEATEPKKEKINPSDTRKDAATIENKNDNPSGSLVASPDSSNDDARSARSSRAEKTETPWLKFVIGFAIIAALCIGALLLQKRRHSPLPLD